MEWIALFGCSISSRWVLPPVSLIIFCHCDENLMPPPERRNQRTMGSPRIRRVFGLRRVKSLDMARLRRPLFSTSLPGEPRCFNRSECLPLSFPGERGPSRGRLRGVWSGAILAPCWAVLGTSWAGAMLGAETPPELPGAPNGNPKSLPDPRTPSGPLQLL